jgi:hypothetical protein
LNRSMKTQILPKITLIKNLVCKDVDIQRQRLYNSHILSN